MAETIYINKIYIIMCEHIDGCVQPGNSRSGLDLLKIDAVTDSFFAGFIRKNKENVGIVGMGSVGRALWAVMTYYYNVVGYDIIGAYDWSKILQCEALFICVQTPGAHDGRLDCSHVDEVLQKLLKDNYEGIVIIKSTLRVGFMDEAIRKYPTLNLVYSPEFMSEKKAFEWTANPDRIVLSGKTEFLDYVQSLYFWAENAKFIRTDFKTAEIGKLAHNAYIALKVTFTNTMESISESAGANAADVMKIVYSDRRVANSAHLEPFKGPYGGKCVPKDTNELINAFFNQTKLLKTADEINTALISSTNGFAPTKETE